MTALKNGRRAFASPEKEIGGLRVFEWVDSVGIVRYLNAGFTRVKDICRRGRFDSCPFVSFVIQNSPSLPGATRPIDWVHGEHE